MKYIQCLFLIFFLFFGCKEDLLDPDRECDDVLNVDWTNATYITPEFDFTSPCFNPNNPEEFVYIKHKPRTYKEAELWKYNLVTKDKKLLAANAFVISETSWSTTDWILFIDTDYRFWRIKSNGDSLITLAYPTGGLQGDWNPDGTKLVIRGSVFNIDGSFDSRIDPRFTPLYSAWSPDGDWIATADTAAAFENVLIYHTHGGPAKRIKLPSTEGLHSPRFSWFPDSKKLAMCSVDDGIFILNIMTEEFNQIKTGCGSSHSRRYITSSVSSDGNKIILSRQDLRGKGRKKIEETYNIVIMNVDGSDEQVIELGE